MPIRKLLKKSCVDLKESCGPVFLAVASVMPALNQVDAMPGLLLPQPYIYLSGTHNDHTKLLDRNVLRVLKIAAGCTAFVSKTISTFINTNVQAHDIHAATVENDGTGVERGTRPVSTAAQNIRAI